MLGGGALRLLHDVGGVALVSWRTVRRLGRLDRAELWRALNGFGVASLPIVVATAAFTGMIMVLQGAVYVRQYGVYDLVGWYTGFSTFREVGPVLIGLMFSGRVGANHTSELATMRVTEQLDALRVLALDVYEVLIAPRTVGMVVAMGALVLFGDLVAIVAGAVCARVLIGVDFVQFALSLTGRLDVDDLLVGMVKALFFGAAIAAVSSHYGLAARGGSTGVGRAVNAQVVACAVAIVLVDFLVTRA
jgi:phospholipid/cholesterol/gamma-HCH transport system permease protein